MSADDKKNMVRDRSNSLKLHDLMLISILLVLCFASYSTLGLISPFFPGEASSKGLTQTEIGLIFSGFQCGLVGASLMAGFVISRLGVKSSILLGAVLTGLSLVIFGLLKFVDNRIVYGMLCFLCRLIEAAGAALVLPSILATFAHKYSNRFLTLQASANMAFILAILTGPSLGGGLYALGGFLLPFLTMGTVVLALSALVACVFPRDVPSAQIRDSGILKSLRTPGIICVLIISTQCGILFTIFGPTLALHLNSQGFSTAVGSLFFMISPALYALTIPLAAFAFHRGFQFSQCCVGLMAGGFSFLLVAPLSAWEASGPLILLVTGLVIQGIGLSLSSQPAVPLLMQEARLAAIFHDEGQASGTLSGLYLCADAIGSAIGPILSGVLTDRMGFQQATSVLGIVFSGAAFIISTAVGVLFWRRRRSTPSHVNRNHRSATESTEMSTDTTVLLP